MRKLVPFIILFLAFSVIIVDAQPKKIAISGRISWSPASDGSNDTDFAVMPHFSMGDETLRYNVQEWGYFPILMPDYVVQFMMNEGLVPFPDGDDADYFNWIDDSIYMDYKTFFEKEGYAAVWNTGTCWSSIGPALKEIPVPVIQGEHANVGARNKLGATYIFDGESSDDIKGEDAVSITLTEAGKTHPLTKGLPEEIVLFGDGPGGPPEDTGKAWQGIYDLVENAGSGTQVLAVWTSDPTKAAIAVVEAGDALADGTTAPARRVMPFYGGGNERPVNGSEQPMQWVVVLDHMTPDGKAVLQRCVQWAIGEEPTAVADWQIE